jgi:hypothetical protein
VNAKRPDVAPGRSFSRIHTRKCGQSKISTHKSLHMYLDFHALRLAAERRIDAISPTIARDIAQHVVHFVVVTVLYSSRHMYVHIKFLGNSTPSEFRVRASEFPVQDRRTSA